MPAAENAESKLTSALTDTVNQQTAAVKAVLAPVDAAFSDALTQLEAAMSGLVDATTAMSGATDAKTKVADLMLLLCKQAGSSSATTRAHTKPTQRIDDAINLFLHDLVIGACTRPSPVCYR
jgi:hypothetical protein